MACKKLLVAGFIFLSLCSIAVTDEVEEFEQAEPVEEEEIKKAEYAKGSVCGYCEYCKVSNDAWSLTTNDFMPRCCSMFFYRGVFSRSYELAVSLAGLLLLGYNCIFYLKITSKFCMFFFIDCDPDFHVLNFDWLIF